MERKGKVVLVECNLGDSSSSDRMEKVPAVGVYDFLPSRPVVDIRFSHARNDLLSRVYVAKPTQTINRVFKFEIRGYIARMK